ncbi:MAG: hypothetical protein JNN00_02845 [Chitinophagaceae bacterium]|nr:hypothetical protein [Chitinophagaceae bacterium]
MSNLSDRLYNYEQNPPGKAWGKIVAALDESHISDKFSSKLYNAEVTPPAMAWDKINAALDEKIAAGKLYNAEVSPPATAWDKIAGSLDAGHSPVVQLPRKSFPLLRYAAAAAVIGAIAFGVVKFSGRNSKPVSEGMATSEEHNSPGNQESILTEDNSLTINNERQENTTGDASNRHSAIDGNIKSSPGKKAKIRYAINDDITPAEAIYAYNEHTPGLADRYVMLMTPNGIIRMSKKLGDIVCCVAGEEQTDNCKDQIKKLQEKLATTPVAVAPGNFMDILSLVSSLNETKL